MDYRSRWAWVTVVTILLALTGAWLTADADETAPVQRPAPRQ